MLGSAPRERWPQGNEKPLMLLDGQELAAEHAPGRHTAHRLPPKLFEIVPDGLYELPGGVRDDDEQAEFAERHALLEKSARLSRKSPLLFCSSAACWIRAGI